MMAWKTLSPKAKANRLILYFLLLWLAGKVVLHVREVGAQATEVPGPYYFAAQTKHAILSTMGPFRFRTDCTRQRDDMLYGRPASHQGPRRTEQNAAQLLYASECWPG